MNSSTSWASSSDSGFAGSVYGDPGARTSPCGKVATRLRGASCDPVAVSSCDPVAVMSCDLVMSDPVDVTSRSVCGRCGVGGEPVGAGFERNAFPSGPRPTPMIVRLMGGAGDGAFTGGAGTDGGAFTGGAGTEGAAAAPGAVPCFAGSICVVSDGSVGTGSGTGALRSAISRL